MKVGGFKVQTPTRNQSGKTIDIDSILRGSDGVDVSMASITHPSDDEMNEPPRWNTCSWKGPGKRLGEQVKSFHSTLDDKPPKSRHASLAPLLPLLFLLQLPHK